MPPKKTTGKKSGAISGKLKKASAPKKRKKSQATIKVAILRPAKHDNITHAEAVAAVKRVKALSAIKESTKV